jgi:hypothetical protein
MRLRNIIAGTLCAIALTFTGCDKTKPKNPFEDIYKPTSAKIRQDVTHPIDKNIKYSKKVHDFTLETNVTDCAYVVNYRWSPFSYYWVKVDISGTKCKSDLGLTDGNIDLNNGVDLIYNIKKSKICSKRETDKANKIFLDALKKVKFRQHLWYSRGGRNEDIL